MKLKWLRLFGALLAGLTMTGCSGNVTSTATQALPADRMVFMVMSSGGLVPPVYYALESPSLVIYGDGRVLTVVKGTAHNSVPARYELTRVDPLAVASFVSTVEARGLINTETDFGKPGVTDLDVTTVMVHGEKGQAEVSVYAFYEQFETGLSQDQRSSRAALREVIDHASNLAGDASRAPYSPDRVVVYELGSDYENKSATKAWPGPPPASFLAPSTKRRSIACGELTGEAATAVYGAALDNPGALWLVDGAKRLLAVNPLPLANACPP